MNGEVIYVSPLLCNVINYMDKQHCSHNQSHNLIFALNNFSSFNFIQHQLGPWLEFVGVIMGGGGMGGGTTVVSLMSPPTY